MLIKVTEDDIKKGRPCDSGNCPISLAVKRVFPDYDNSVGVEFITVMADNNVYKQYVMPTPAKYALHYFDRGRGMTPFEFELGEPCYG